MFHNDVIIWYTHLRKISILLISCDLDLNEKKKATKNFKG